VSVTVNLAPAPEARERIELFQLPSIKTTPSEHQERFRLYLIKERGLTGSTAYTYEHNLQTLERILNKGRSAISADDLRWMLRSTNYAPSTKNGLLVAARTHHKWEVLEGRSELNGIMAVAAPKQVRVLRPPLSSEEVPIVLDACNRDRAYRLVYLPLFAGLRVSDSAGISPDEWKADRLSFIGVKEKRRQEIPLHPELERVKHRILSHTVSRDTLKHVCRSLSTYTGIKFSTHTLRRTFSQRHLDLGTDPFLVDDLLGHKPKLVLLQSYGAFPWDTKVEAQERLWYEMPTPAPSEPKQLSLF
jgi:site-specific recombinase XerD